MKKITIFCVSLLVLLLSSCSMKYEGTGSVSLTAESSSSAGARSVMPDDYVEPDYLRAILKSSSGTSVTSADFTMDNPTISFSNIPFASYTAIVYGYSDEERTSIIAMGQESITVAAGETTSATIYISPVADIEGEDLKGTVEIFLSFAEDMQIDEIRLVDLEGNVLATQTVTLDSSKSVTFRREVDAELNQRLYLEFYYRREYVGESVDEIYNIYSGQVAHSTQNDLSENDPYQNLFFDEARKLSNFKINELEELNKLSVTFSVPAYEFDEIELSITGGNATERKSLPYSKLEEEGYIGKDYIYTFENLKDSTEYTIKARIKHTTGQYSPFSTSSKTTATPLTEISIIYSEDEIAALSPKDTYNFELKMTPENATDFGGTWQVSNSGIASIDGNGLLTVDGIGNFTVSYTAVNNNQSDSVSVNIRLVRPEVTATISDTRDSIELKWNNVGIADKYEVYRKTNSGQADLVKTITDISGTLTYTDTDITTGKTYSYQVKAIHTTSENYSESDWTNAISTDNPDITIGFVDGPFDLDNIMEGVKQNQVFTTSDNIVIEVKDLSDQGIVSYAWYLNKQKEPVSTGRQVTITSATEGINSTQDVADQTLILIVTDDKGYQYSGSLNLYYVDALENLPTYDVESLNTENGSTRFSTKLSDGKTKRTINLVAKTSNDLQYIDYSTSNDSIATVKNGVVTLEGGDGEVTIKAKPTYGGGNSAELTLDVYQATVTSAEQLLNAVNTELGKLINVFGGDFWKGRRSGEVYGDDNYTLVTGSGLIFSDPNDGYVSFNKKAVTLSGIGNTEFNTESESNIVLSVYDPNPTWGYDGTDYIGTINGTLKVYLPYNQGIATIIYNVVVQDGNTNRGGFYSVIFDKPLTTEIKDISNAKITDGDGITKVIYDE